MLLLRVARATLLAFALLVLVGLLSGVVAGAPSAWTAAVLDLGAGGDLTLGIRLGLVPGLLLLLVSGVGALVASYAVRNLEGQPRLARFAALEVVAVLALALAVSAASLPVLAVGWTVGGLAISALVAHSGTAAAQAAAGVVRRRLLVGDALLWAGVLVVGLGLGTWDVEALDDVLPAADPRVVTLAAVLVVLAGAVRSALVPAHRWLPETAAAPSPVSALLHAGLVNGVGLLALLLWPLLSASWVARGLLLGLATATAVLCTAQLRTRPDVKGRLAASTSAQMGYVGVQAALGLPAAVLAHVVGHGLWKASLFLGAGGAVQRMRSEGAVATGSPSRSRARVGDALAATLLVVALAVVPGPWGVALVEGPAALVPLAVAIVATAVALRAAREAQHGSRASRLATLAVVTSATAYVLGLRALTTAVEVDLGGPAGWGSAAAPLLLVVVALLLAVGIAGWRLDRALSSGSAPRLSAAVVRTSLPAGGPAGILPRAHQLDLRGWPTGSELPGQARLEETRASVLVASGVVGPVWPLGSFVASSPLAGLETLGFRDALAVASASWGSASGPDAAWLRRAVAAGTVTVPSIERALLAAGVHAEPGTAVRLLVGDEPTASEVTAAGVALDRLGLERVATGPVVRPTTLTPGERLAATGPRGTRLAERADAVGDLLLARALGSTAWPSPVGPWAALRADAGALDRALRVRGAGPAVAALPEDPAAAVCVLLDHLGVPDADRVPLLARLISARAGWTGHLAWRDRYGVPVRIGADATADLLDAVAVRLTLQGIVLDAVAPGLVDADGAVPDPEPVDRAPALARAASAADMELSGLGVDEARSLLGAVDAVDAAGAGLLRVMAWEDAHRTPVLHELATRARELVDVSGSAHQPGGPDAQLVTCIDVRSERLRRHVESLGPWETFGHAGFFGVPVTHVSPDGATTERCPAIMRPSHTVHETAGTTGRAAWASVDVHESAGAVESRPVAPFALAEGAGWIVGPISLLRTAFPALWDRLSSRVRVVAGAPERGALGLVQDDGNLDGGAFSVAEAVSLAGDVLRGTGLLDPAPLVVLCGHGGSAQNNPHLAAYDCGACGGQVGDVSARMLAQLLNDPRIRAGLTDAGITIPAETWFVAALHDTTRDRVTVLDRELVPAWVVPRLERFEQDLCRAADAVALERVDTLPGAPRTRRLGAVRRHLDRRAADWAQPRPEWGLARNAAIVIGPRSLTTGLDLDGRVFLQSYRPDLDPDGAALEGMLTGPLVVAQWINAQYWFSTVDPVRFGAGDKTTHNVIAPPDGHAAPLSGVLTGARGDLRVGLPWQAVSVHAPVDGRWRESPVHEPVRLLAVVCATPAAVDAVLARAPQVARLVMGEWIALTVVDPGSGRVLRCHPSRGWVPVEETSVDLRSVRAGR